MPNTLSGLLLHTGPEDQQTKCIGHAFGRNNGINRPVAQGLHIPGVKMPTLLLLVRDPHLSTAEK